MRDTKDESVTSVEVTGFVGWITSAVAYGELEFRAPKKAPRRASMGMVW
jgi:hypothetical protein